MNTDINKQIEDLKYILSWSSNINYNERVVISDTVHYLESQRWRKVSEGLPPIVKDKKSKEVLVKTKYNRCYVAVYNYNYEDWIDKSVAISGVIEWKPID